MIKQLSIFILPLFIFPTLLFSQDLKGVKYGSEDRQFLDLYIADSECPTPVFFHAHGNGGNTDMPAQIITELREEGISVISWESLTSINTPEDVLLGWEDAELMFSWVIQNANQYNLDTTQFIIGGSSRGSILSWKYGHRPNPNIIGLYMYNALPDGVWVDTTWWYPPNEVTPASPPLFFVYRFEPDIDFDIHDPINGLKIMETYDALGIGDRDTMIHSIEYTNNKDRFQFLTPFAKTLIDPCQVVNINTPTESTDILVFPNPFTNHFSVKGLLGNETFTLVDPNGRILSKSKQLENIQTQIDQPGVYVLRIESDKNIKPIKIIKQ